MVKDRIGLNMMWGEKTGRGRKLQEEGEETGRDRRVKARIEKGKIRKRRDRIRRGRKDMQEEA